MSKEECGLSSLSSDIAIAWRSRSEMEGFFNWISKGQGFYPHIIRKHSSSAHKKDRFFLLHTKRTRFLTHMPKWHGFPPAHPKDQAFHLHMNRTVFCFVLFLPACQKTRFFTFIAKGSVFFFFFFFTCTAKGQGLVPAHQQDRVSRLYIWGQGFLPAYQRTGFPTCIPKGQGFSSAPQKDRVCRLHIKRTRCSSAHQRDRFSDLHIKRTGLLICTSKGQVCLPAQQRDRVSHLHIKGQGFSPARRKGSSAAPGSQQNQPLPCASPARRPPRCPTRWGRATRSCAGRPWRSPAAAGGSTGRATGCPPPVPQGMPYPSMQASR